MIIGNEVCAIQWGNLTLVEVEILFLHGEGESKFTIMERHGLNQSSLHMAEKAIRVKIGAKSPEHMVSKAFQLGILTCR